MKLIKGNYSYIYPNPVFSQNYTGSFAYEKIEM